MIGKHELLILLKFFKTFVKSVPNSKLYNVKID